MQVTPCIICVIQGPLLIVAQQRRRHGNRGHLLVGVENTLQVDKILFQDKLRILSMAHDLGTTLGEGLFIVESDVATHLVCEHGSRAPGEAKSPCRSKCINNSFGMLCYLKCIYCKTIEI